MIESGKRNQDHLVKALALEGKVRIYAVSTTNMVSKSQKRHDTWATATAALGRTLSVGAMMGAMLKGEDKLTLQVKGGGPLGSIIVDANAKGEVRGYVSRPHTHLPLNEEGKLDVGGAVGHDGLILVSKDLGMKEPYHGSSKLISGEIGEDFTLYFAQSEQTPAAVAVGVMVNPDHTVKASGGYIIQLLPGVSEDYITQLETRLKEAPSVSSMADKGYSPQQMITTILPDQEIQWLETMPVTYSCPCSKERVKETLISLGKKELQQIIEEDGQAEVQCHFCNEKYQLIKEDLDELVAEASK